ncbi:hypothetical protein [Streptomyces himalayensis]|uniref:Uncharacterized protein n=1 Tax=Streptomyces himalayensis subsp. himalayensis TaxID=2756131 RepID=A0A7W0DUD6_9ACTN|nr:hypothetical protein [Streptomyces himalayensis]MBA2951402.1 hypothetical protein [Streptomyces himalayensis subsp. himalayensis]
MNVEIPPHLRDTATQLGVGVPYALKVLAGDGWGGTLVRQPDSLIRQPEASAASRRVIVRASAGSTS